MADISMCQNAKCKDRDSCYRFTATPNLKWQSYILLDSKNKNECKFYWDNKNPYAAHIYECKKKGNNNEKNN